MSFELSEKFQHDTIRMNFSEDSPPTYRIYRNLLTSQSLNCIFYLQKKKINESISVPRKHKQTTTLVLLETGLQNVAGPKSGYVLEL